MNTHPLWRSLEICPAFSPSRSLESQCRRCRYLKRRYSNQPYRAPAAARQLPAQHRAVGRRRLLAVCGDREERCDRSH